MAKKKQRRVSRHEVFVATATEAIDNVFSDTSVSPQRTLESLSDLRDDIEIKQRLIRNDLKKLGQEV